MWQDIVMHVIIVLWFFLSFEGNKEVVFGLVETKETKLERAEFTLQLFMFVTAEKEGQMFITFFLSIFCRLLSPRF